MTQLAKHLSFLSQGRGHDDRDYFSHDKMLGALSYEEEKESKVVTLDFSASSSSYDFSVLNETLINYTPSLNDYVGNTFRCFISASMREMDALKIRWNRHKHQTVDELFDDIIDQLRANNADMLRTVNLISQVRRILTTGVSNNLFETQLLNTLIVLDIMRQQINEGGVEDGSKWSVFYFNSGYTYRSPYADSLKEFHYLITNSSKALGIEFITDRYT